MPIMHSEMHINMVCVLTCKPIFISIATFYYLLTKTLFLATSVVTIRLRPAPDKWSSCLQHLTILEVHLTRIEIYRISISILSSYLYRTPPTAQSSIYPTRSLLLLLKAGFMSI